MRITLTPEIIKDYLNCAIAHQKLVRIQYTSQKQHLTERTIEPAEMIGTTGVLAFDHMHKGWRHFKLESIHRITLFDYDRQMLT